jgi:serine protease Do/serine protease DegQ
MVQRFGLEEKKGVIIAQIEPNSLAADAGLVPGDVILGINRQPVNSLTDYNKIITGLKGNALVKTARGYFLIKGD